jgi:hypothetical protein
MQIEEMRALEAGQGQVQADRRAALGAMLGSAVEAGVKTGAQQKIIQGARAPSPSSVLALSKQLGVSEDEARGIIETSVTNPELMKYLTMVKGVK